jgi:serine/threonine protein kinase
MLSNPNSDYFYNCDQLPYKNQPQKDVTRGEVISRVFIYNRPIGKDMIQVVYGSVDVFVIKILPWEDPKSHDEYRKYCQMSLILDKTYIFPNLVGWFEYVGLPFHWRMQHLGQTQGLYEEDALLMASQPDTEAKRQLFLVYESINLQFKELEYEKETFKKALFILLHGLYMGRKFLNLTHNRLTAKDLMFRRIISTPYDFNIEGTRFIIENVEYVPIIVDFGYPESTLNQVKFSSDLLALEDIFPNSSKLFKSSQWQTSQRSYSNDYLAIVRILLYSKYFKSYKKVDNYIKPPIGAGTYNRIYKTEGDKSVVRMGIVDSEEREFMFVESAKVLKQIFTEKEKYGPSLFREIKEGRWADMEDKKDITVIDLSTNALIYLHEIEYLEGDTLATDVFPNKMGCFSMVWFLYAGYYSNMRHRDIKPENCVIRKYQEAREFTFASKNYRYKFKTDRIPVFIDFDMVSLDPSSLLRNVIGSIYTCPPALLISKFIDQDLYDDKTYDWWSLGITIFSWYTWNELSNFQIFTNIVKLFFVKNEIDERRVHQSKIIMIATLIFYCHVNYIVFPEQKGDHIYGFLKEIQNEILESFEKSEQLQKAKSRYASAPMEIKKLIRKFLSDDTEERVSDMEQFIFECFMEFQDEEEEEEAEYVFIEKKTPILFTPDKSPLPKVEAFSEINFSPMLTKTNEEEEDTSPFVYKKINFVESYETISPKKKKMVRKATPYVRKLKPVEEEDEKTETKRVLFQ